MIRISRGRRAGRFGLLAVGAVAAAFAFAGCSNDDAAPAAEATETVTAEEVAQTPAENEIPEPTAADIAALNDVTVTGDTGAEPTLEFTQPFAVTAPVTRLIADGSGAALVDGQQITVHGVSYSGDGEKLFSTWEADEAQNFILGSPSIAPLNPPLTGAHVGARVLLANPTVVGGQPTTVLTLFEVIDAQDIITRAEGETVTPAAGLPVVTLDDDGVPSIEIPSDYVAPDELVIQTLIRGEGAEVRPEQTVTVQYTGWLLDGTEFDSSWTRGEPATFLLQGVIPGWTQGLAGQTIGSQVLLVIPPDMAYGDQAAGAIPPGSTLAFVVDILSAQ